jgi:hypothetical protein
MTPNEDGTLTAEIRNPLLEKSFKPNPALADQTLGGKSVVLDYDHRRILGMNTTGSRVWALLDGTRSIADICGVLARENELDLDTVVADVEPFVRELLDRELLVEV